MYRLLFCFLFALSGFCRGEILVRDDTGQMLKLARPAQRIVSLAPHITETLFAAGAGARIVGAVDYSDYPPAAKKLPRLGSSGRVDIEALLALKPDLVIAWQSGNPPALIDKLRVLGLPVYVNQSGKLENVADDLARYGQLAGNPTAGDAAASRFRQRFADLQRRHADKPVVRLFYEVWNQPLMTIGGPQVISDVIRLCGGENIFGALNTMAPTVNTEAVIAACPEAIIAAGMGDARPEWLDDWKKWPALPAVRQGNLFHIHPDLMHRHTPRLLDGAEQLCGFLEVTRHRRGSVTIQHPTCP